MSTLNQTPSAGRLHISFFGCRNAGKSSVVNAVTGQELSKKGCSRILFKHLAFFFVACDAIFDNITHAILRIFQFNYNSKKNSVVKIFFSVIFLSEVVCIYLTI